MEDTDRLTKLLGAIDYFHYRFEFFDVRLSLETASLAAGSQVVCAFVNDDLGASVVEELAALGVKLIALRCAGFNNVDLGACERHGVSVVRVPALARLTTFNNVLVTSHQGFLTHEALANIADTTLENIREFEVGRAPPELTNRVAHG
jgi:lactate dehydrogenase-like 2-hydroxyacid dehydrogenase